MLLNWMLLSGSKEWLGTGFVPKVGGVKRGGKQEARREMKRRWKELSIDINRYLGSTNTHSICAVCLVPTICQVPC